MKKALVVFLAVAMLFAFSAAALAAPTDLDDQPTNVQDAFNKFLAFKFIEGYGDGTVKPTGEITRAEFAKIVCMITGLSEVATALQNSSSQYTDVKAGEWYVGWIAAATSGGFFQGYGDGTFLPNKRVSDYEVLAVLLRVAGYKDEGLGSVWPYNYVTQAAKLGWLSIVTVTGTDATRATAILLANTALFEDFVAYDKNLSVFKPQGMTVAENYRALGETKNVVIKNFGLNKNGVFGLYIYEGTIVDDNGFITKTGFDVAQAATGTFYPLFENYDIANGLSVYDMLNVYAKVTTTKNGQVAYIEPITEWLTVTTFTVNTGRTAITIGGTSYAGAFGNIEAYFSTTGKFGAQWKMLVDPVNGQFLDGYVIDIANDSQKYGVVNTVGTAVTMKTGTGKGSFASAANLKDKKVLVIIDGKKAELSDIKTNDWAIQHDAKFGYDYIYEVYSAVPTFVSSITGNADGGIASFSIDGKSYTNAGVKLAQGTGTYDTANVKLFNDNLLKGQSTVATFYANGVLAFLSYGARADATKVTGLITGGKVVTELVYDDVTGSYLNKPIGYETITLFTSNGETKTYKLKDNGKGIWGDFGGGTGFPIAVNALVTLAFDENDEFVEVITKTTFTGNWATEVGANTANNTVSDGTNVYQVNAGTRIFVVEGTTGNYKYSMKTFGAVVSGSGSSAVIKVDAGQIDYLIAANGLSVQYIIINGSATAATGNLVGVIQDLYADGDRIKFRGIDANYKKALSVPANPASDDVFKVAGSKVGHIVEYTVTGTGANATATYVGTIYDRENTTAYPSYDVKAAEGNLFSYVDGSDIKTLMVDADTVFYVYGTNGTYTGPGSASDLAANNAKVVVLEKDGMLAKSLVVIR